MKRNILKKNCLKFLKLKGIILKKYQRFKLDNIIVRVDFLQICMNANTNNFLQIQLNGEWIFGYFGNELVEYKKGKISLTNKFIKSPDFNKIWKILQKSIYFNNNKVQINLFLEDIINKLNNNEWKEIDNINNIPYVNDNDIEFERMYFSHFRTIPVNTNTENWSFYQQFEWNENSIWFDKPILRHLHLMNYESYKKLLSTHTNEQIQNECWSGNGKFPVFTNNIKKILESELKNEKIDE